MRIAFFGATKLGYVCCKALLNAGHKIVGIFTIEEEFNISYSPDKPVKNVLYKDFGVLGKEYNIPTFKINSNLKTYFKEFEDLNVDFIIAIGWYYIIPNSFISITPKGAAGIHGSLLPKYRGNSPLVWAIINGEKETGVSFFYFTKGVDEGDIIGQQKIPIRDEDNIQSLLQKVEIASVELLLNEVPKIALNTSIPQKQNHYEATYFPARSPEDGLIDWSWDSKKINNFIRAQTKPYPGAFTIIEGKKVVIWEADIFEL